MIDDIERSVHFLCLFWKNNPIYLVCSLFYYVISSLLLGGTAKSFLIVFVVYAVSLIIGFSSLGEKFLRLLNRVRPLETKRKQNIYSRYLTKSMNMQKKSTKD